MIVFFLILGLIAFLLILAFAWQREQRNALPDEENYVEPKEVSEEDEESTV